VEIPDPYTYGEELQEWADAVVDAMNLYPSIMPLGPEMNWQYWGLVFFNDPSLGTFNPPNPFNYDNWKIWGEQLAAALDNAPDAPPSANHPSNINTPGAYILAQSGVYLKAQNGNLLTTQPSG
jgi:hypothetical protein